jgi:hypothetical protein
MRPHPEQPNETLPRFRFILLSIVLTIAFRILVFGQSAQLPAAHMMQLDEIRKFACDLPVPEGFRCAWIFDTGLPPSGGLIASVTGGTVDQISIYLDGTLYTVEYDPPLKRDDRFASLRRGAKIPARFERDDLILECPDHTRVRGKIVQRERIFPNDPQPA